MSSVNRTSTRLEVISDRGVSSTRPLVVETHASSCYFRTTVAGNGRKALLQITERCNLRCAHCFVSATSAGLDMPEKTIAQYVLPRLIAARVRRITLTGGEPFAHPEILKICDLVVKAGIPVGICTNAVLIDEVVVQELVALGGVHVNISLDGFSEASHGKFRGGKNSFQKTRKNAIVLADAGLLQGILCTPTVFSEPEEFLSLCEFAQSIGAKYVLMNPLSPLGRGVHSQRLAASNDMLRRIRSLTERFSKADLDVNYIRFPNDNKPLGGCSAGKIIYTFVNGDTCVCPYLVFAARTPGSLHDEREFMVGNIIEGDISEVLDEFNVKKYEGSRSKRHCAPCGMKKECGKGCPAAVVARGGRAGELDEAQCPVPTKNLLPIVSRGSR